MSAQFLADVRVLFVELGVEVENVRAFESDLVIDRFDQRSGGAVVRASVPTCLVQVAGGADLAA